MSMFINRKDEIKKLEEIFKSKKAELVLLYGRRRVGKSRLLVESIKNKNALYLLADASNNILDILSKQVKDKFVKFNNWDDFFEFVLKSDYEIFVIDEFQYLYQVNKAWPTILQRWWEELKNTKKKIILCGSIISTIYKIARGYGSALYGRKTYEINMLPLQFRYISGFLKNYNTEDLIKAYCILGGIPRYLEEFDQNKTILENIGEKIIEKTSFLYNEPLNLLSEEFRDFSTYLSILLAISEGKNKFNEIADYSRIGTNKLPKYLNVLERTEIIKKEIPITEKKLKSKITRYYLKDNFYRFWLIFVFRNKAGIERGLNKEILFEIEKNLNAYFGRVFEEVCQEIVLSKKRSIFKIGRWWFKDKEIDILALNEKEKIIYITECKWKENVDAIEIFENLKNKAKDVIWNNGKRKEEYLIFAKSFKEKPKIRNLTLVDLRDIKEYLKGA